MIADMESLAAHLNALQRERGTFLRCELTNALSARISDAALAEALVAGLPMAQGIQRRILRSRGKGAVLTAKIRYRQGVRMIDRFRGEAVPLTDEENESLAAACSIAEEVRGLEENVRFWRMFDWVCQNIAYVHTAPGQKGYERLVGASGALRDRKANCQGFADVLYLLCGLCDITCEYRCGKGKRKLHLWNAVCLDGKWQEVDASKAARAAAD